MSKQHEALNLALKALQRGRPQIVGVLVQQDQDNAIQAILEALAEPEPKPVVWIRHENEWVGLAPKDRLPIETPRPDARKPLTDSEVFNLAADYYEGYGFKAVEFARAIERAHGITE